MTQENCVKVFKELGFIELEARTYTYLVQHAPATGYGIAKAIGQMTATSEIQLESNLKAGSATPAAGWYDGSYTDNEFWLYRHFDNSAYRDVLRTRP